MSVQARPAIRVCTDSYILVLDDAVLICTTTFPPLRFSESARRGNPSWAWSMPWITMSITGTI